MTFWTDERTETLRGDAAAGLSSEEIANKFDYMVTRSAVIGKCHREGIQLMGIAGPRRYADNRPSRANPRKSTLSAVRQAQASGPVMFPSEPAAPPQVAEPPSGPGCSLLELTADTCRWPSGDEAPFTFCGAAPVEGLPYCPFHSTMAYRPSRVR